MRRRGVALAAVAGIAAVAAGAAVTTSNAPVKATASSHREAPLIANDPTADITDFYMFRSPDQTQSVTLLMNVIPFEAPPEGPNYYNLDDSARYGFHIDQNGDGKPEISWYLQTKTTVRNGGTFLYATGPVSSLNDPDLNVRQSWTLWEQRGPGGTGKMHRIGSGTTAPPNIGKSVFGSNANYEAVANSAIRSVGGGIKVFVGPREDPFFIDVGRIFDLVDVGGQGTDNTAGFNVHTIGLQVPLDLIRQSAGQPVVGGWTTVDRQKTKVERQGRRLVTSTSWVQVERLGQPLINEVIIPLKDKDRWNSLPPSQDAQFQKYYEKPGLVAALNKIVLNGALGLPTSLNAAESGRGDLTAILLKGFKYPNVGTPALDLTFPGGGKPVDELRLNTSVEPTRPIANQDRRGLMSAFFASPNPQLDGWPNGRRLGDDVTDIAVAALFGLPIDKLIPTSLQRPYAPAALGEANSKAVADATGLPIVDAALSKGADGVLHNDRPFSDAFPFAATPFGGDPVGSY